MEHVVFFPAPDGSPAFRRVASLEEAVRLVEHLRNVEGVASVSVHSLTEVPLAFRAYYRVEVPHESSAAVPVDAVPAQTVAEQALPHIDAEPSEPVTVEPIAEVPALALVEDVREDDAEAVAGNGHRETTPASLGFFA